eukprot:6204909-Pleurochrysis_carterae.AAC.1
MADLEDGQRLQPVKGSKGSKVASTCVGRESSDIESKKSKSWHDLRAPGALSGPSGAQRREKTGEHDDAAACARKLLWEATVNARPVGKLLKRSLRYLALTSVLVGSLSVLTSDRHALRHVADCRFSARGNLHRDLDLAAGRPAVLADTQSSE